MAIEENTVKQNQGYVEQANGSMSGAQVDDIERRAKARVVTAREESARAESAEKEVMGAASTEPNAKLYGDIALDAIAPGLKAAGMAADLASQRHEDTRASGASFSPLDGAATSRSIDDDIAGASRKPGMYRAPVQQHAFGADITDTPAKPGISIRTKPTDDEDLMASTTIARMSLKDQHKDAVGSWGIKEGSEKMAGVQLAKKMTYGHELSSEQALQSVHVARQQHSASMGMANQLAPGMSMAMNGPSFNPDKVLGAAKNVSEWDDPDRWRS